MMITLKTPRGKDGPSQARAKRRSDQSTSGSGWSRRRAFLASVEVLEEIVLLSNYSVTSTADSGANTLRQAILNSNGHPSQANTISFNIAGSGVQTINVLSALPTVTAPVVIDGTSQPGYAGSPLIELNGTSAGGGSNGLVVSTSGSTVAGLVVDRFGNDGIEIFGNYDVITSSDIGTNPAGSAASANGREGVLVNGSNDTIGGSTSGSGDVISGNTLLGIQVYGSGSADDVIEGDKIGTNAGGTSAVPNKGTGVLVNAQASGVRIGTNGDGVNDALERNVISGNTSYGVQIADPGTNSNVVAGNFIGTDVTGKLAVANGGGVLLNNKTTSNRVGTDGISADDSGEDNVISGNNGMGVPGVVISDAGTDSNVVVGNLIGTDVTGSLALGNGGVGLFIENGAASNRIGTNGDGHGDADERNVISNNAYQGLYIGGSGTNSNVVAGNLIGTDLGGRVAMGNGNNGVWIAAGARSNRIGVNPADPDPKAETNVIAANGYSGVILTDSGTSGNAIDGNLIGTDVSGALPLGNGDTGITLETGANSNSIGGTVAGAGNTIAFNTNSGIVLYDPTTLGNSIRGNSIDSNGSIGINFGNAGVLLNNDGDRDPGPNGNQNYPIIASAAPGSTTVVTGTLNSRPNLTYAIDLYADSRADPTSFGGGKRYLGSVSVTTDASGNAIFTANVGSTSTGEWVTATATDPSGDTSEFSESEQLPFAVVARNSNSWVNLGPSAVSAYPRRSGRITGALADPTNPNIMYVASYGGGVWKTTDWLDPSPVWSPLTDGQASLLNDYAEARPLAIDTQHPNTIYAAMTSPGGGVLKSTDGGATWTLEGTSTFGDASFGAIIVDPSDSNILYAAALYSYGGTGSGGGIYKSLDGGVSWNKSTTSITSGGVADLAIDPTSPSTLYAGVINATAGATNGIYKTTNGGTTWTLLTVGLPTGSTVGASLRLSLAPESPSTVYAAIMDPTFVDPVNGENNVPRRYVTTDAGAHWTRMTNIPGANDNRTGHLMIAVDPTNPAVVYTNGDHEVYRSTDHGTTWTGPIFGDDPSQANFDDSGALVVTGDGGVFRQANSSAPFAFKQGNLGTVTFDDITLDPTNINVVYGISQDQFYGVKFTGGPVWTYLTAGSPAHATDEVGKILVDPTDPSRLYEYDPNNTTSFVYRSDDGGANFTAMGTGIDVSQNGFSLAYTSQRAFVMDPNNHNRLILGTSHVYETTNDGVTWTQISKNTDLSPGHFLTMVAVAPNASGTIYAATDDGHLYATTTDGSTWAEKDTGLPAVNYNIVSDIQVDPANSLHLIVVTSGYGGTNHVWSSSDGGGSWTNLTGNLPPTFQVNALTADWRSSTPKLYVGTTRGVFRSVDLGGTWAAFGQGLPAVDVTDLEFLPQFNLLAAGTYGRGAFEILTTSPVPAVSVTSSAPSSTYGQQVTFTATVAAVAGNPMPTGTIQFVVDGSDFGGPVPLSGGRASITEAATLGAGSHLVQADYSGDATYASASGGFTQVVNKVHLSVVPDNLSRMTGQANPPLTAHLSGFVLGEDATSANVAGSAILSTTAVTASPAGPYPITVASAGTLLAANYDFPSGIFGVGSLTVRNATQLTLAVAPNPSVFGQVVVFTATIGFVGAGSGIPTGTITFLDGTTALGTAMLNASGFATLSTSSLAVGTHSISASYPGDAYDLSSVSQSVALTVGQDATSTTLAATPNPSVFGQTVMLAATVAVASPGSGTPTGPVTFLEGSKSLGTAMLVGGVARLMISTFIPGLHSIKASYGGDINSTTSVSQAATLVVDQAATSTTLAIQPNPVAISRAANITATVAVVAPGAGRPTGTVRFFDGSKLLGSASVDGSGHAAFSTSTLAFGLHSITATYSGDADDVTSSSARSTLRVGDAKPGDFDGDGKTDIAIYDRTTATFAILYSGGGSRVQQFGNATHVNIPIVGDFDGDGKTDIAIYDQTTATFAILYSGGGSLALRFGDPAHMNIPVAGDFDGDGRTNIAIFDQTTATFAILEPNGMSRIQQLGNVDHVNVPVAGDFDGDGKTDIAVFDQSISFFLVQYSGGGSRVQQLGNYTHVNVPVAGDFDGDGKTDLAVYDQATSVLLALESGGGTIALQFGASTDVNIPLAGDFDGDGRTDIAIYDVTVAEFLILDSGGGSLVQPFGSNKHANRPV